MLGDAMASIKYPTLRRVRWWWVRCRRWEAPGWKELRKSWMIGPQQERMVSNRLFYDGRPFCKQQQPWRRGRMVDKGWYSSHRQQHLHRLYCHLDPDRQQRMYYSPIKWYWYSQIGEWTDFKTTAHTCTQSSTLCFYLKIIFYQPLIVFHNRK